MLDFQRKKDIDPHTLGSTSPRESSYIYLDQSKNFYDIILKHDNQIKQMESEIINLKTQIIEFTTKIPLLTSQNSNIINDKNTEILKLKEDIKEEIIKELNNVIISQQNEFQEQIKNLKEDIELIDDSRNNNKLLEINNSLENLNQQLILNNEEKNNLENIIFNKVDNDKKEIKIITNNINKRIDNFDLDFDRLIQSLKVQFLNTSNTINQLELSKLNISDYEKQIETINQNIEELNNKIEIFIQENRNYIINKTSNRNILTTTENDNEENELEEITDKKLNAFKEELYTDIEKINLKVLNELKNQASDIKIFYQELSGIKTKLKNKNKNNKKEINLELQNKNGLTIENINDFTSNIMSIIEEELSKKANLDQLNFALETQAKLNEAFSSATRICRFCWDSEGVLISNKYIQWSIQNINTALDVFKWENNSENISILQNGVYKITIGIIGADTKKNFLLVFNNDENIVLDSRTNNSLLRTQNENDIYNDKGNVKFMEKYIACVENTKIKIILFDNNFKENESTDIDNSEEAFLEIIKII